MSLIKSKLVRYYFIVFPLVFFNQKSSAQQITLNLQMVLDIAETNHSSSLSTDQVHKIKSAYLQLAYYNHLISLYNTYMDKTKRLVDIAILKYELGDIDQLEEMTWIVKYNEIENKAGTIESQQAIAQNRLKMLLLTERDIMPVETLLYLYPIDKTEEDYADFLEYVEGYPEDSILKDTSAFLHFKRKENALLHLVAVQNQLQHYEDYVLPMANTYDAYATLYMENEEIEFTEYFMYISRVFEIQKEYIDMIGHYNEAALSLELLLRKG